MACYEHIQTDSTPCQGVQFAREEYRLSTTKLVAALKRKREENGFSLRKLSAEIGVSFSTLARIERGEGEPDHNSTIRILNWLGSEASETGVALENVTHVHFRAAKQISSETVKFLIEAANAVREQVDREEISRDEIHKVETDIFSDGASISYSKDEMESMAEKLRENLGLAPNDPLDALRLRIEGVEVFSLGDIKDLSPACRRHLVEKAASEWSAMSVPLDAKGGAWAVIRNDSHSIERQLVTYLEEIWHISLGHKLTRVAKIGNAYGRTFDPIEEHDAYFLASACLLPRSSIEEFLGKKETAKTIAAHFGVSSELVEYRIKRLGLWPVYTGKKITLD